MKFGKRIQNGQLAKVSGIITLLVLLPRIVILLQGVEIDTGFFSGANWPALVLRGVMFFGLTFTALQLNTNIRFELPFLEQWKIRSGVIVLNAVAIVITVSLFRLLYPLLTGSGIPTNESRYVWIIFLALAIIVYIISDIINLQRFRQEKILENEKLMQQNLEKELAALRNQVNPHFLFNALNSLLGLVKDSKPAAQFVKHLSFLYRYILQSGETQLVTLKEELRFLESYEHLITVRYRERFRCKRTIDHALLATRIPPLALQLLVENAVKHNEISSDYPLEVCLRNTADALVIENVIRPRSNFAESSGVGLANLNTRYQLLFGKAIKVATENGIFRVELPISN